MGRNPPRAGPDNPARRAKEKEKREVSLNAPVRGAAAFFRRKCSHFWGEKKNARGRAGRRGGAGEGGGAVCGVWCHSARTPHAPLLPPPSSVTMAFATSMKGAAVAAKAGRTSVRAREMARTRGARGARAQCARARARARRFPPYPVSARGFARRDSRRAARAPPPPRPSHHLPKTAEGTAFRIA